MGFIVLFAVGGVLAWLASILTRGDDGRTIAQYLGAGIVGAQVAGVLASQESLMVGLSAWTLLAGMAGSVVALAVLTFARQRMAR
ncbi:GlsB/YeaQ/YmgE family stress response membrane protein [Tsuneonella sp. HG249]